MPIIAVTRCKSIDDYLKSVTRAGADPRVLDPETDRSDTALDAAEGLLLTGGPDVDPARYGERRHDSVSAAPERDEFETALIRQAIARRLPIFGICRGMQILNVALGGSLIQDLPSYGAANRTIEHSRPTPLCAIAHEVWVSPNSALASLMPDKLAEADTCAVNSRHHQAVNRVAEGFDVVATAPDGVIEAIERPGRPFCVAVQWHPENFWRTGEFRELFEGFVEACRTGK